MILILFTGKLFLLSSKGQKKKRKKKAVELGGMGVCQGFCKIKSMAIFTVFTFLQNPKGLILTDKGGGLRDTDLTLRVFFCFLLSYRNLIFGYFD